jgi:hypothetical protein
VEELNSSITELQAEADKVEGLQSTADGLVIERDTLNVFPFSSI